MRSRLSFITGVLAFGALCGGGVAYADIEPPPPTHKEADCQTGEFCLWTGDRYQGQAEKLDLRSANPEECIPLPDEFEAHSFINHLDSHVTVYQGADCSTEGDFTTYPGHGTYVPQAPFVVRAIQVWD